MLLRNFWNRGAHWGTAQQGGGGQTRQPLGCGVLVFRPVMVALLLLIPFGLASASTSSRCSVVAGNVELSKSLSSVWVRQANVAHKLCPGTHWLHSHANPPRDRRAHNSLE